ncbi:MAG: FAD-linked oxidase C-terminal domain-containing protein [Thiolinea sp.]
MSTTNIPAAIEQLRQQFGERLSTGQSVRELHGRDESYTPPALPDAVVFPENTQEVATLINICAAHRCPVIPFGVGTSLEGHVIPVRGGISVDTSRMNRILAIHASDLDAVVQPGVTRMQLNNELRHSGLMFTVDPGANATLGGMAATRASGTNAVRYGTMRENVLALEAVLPNGEIIRTGTRARKSATGYDLTKLLVGSEGTLGIITELTVRLFGRPEGISAATCAFESVADAVDTVIMTIQSGIPVARIELVDELEMHGMNLYNPDLKLPEKPHLFLEFHGTPAGVLEQIELFREISAEFGASHFQSANDEDARRKLWHARHNSHYASKALRRGSEIFSTDCCVPISALAECIARTRAAIEQAGLIAPIVGHVGDGNFHVAIVVDRNDTEEMQRAFKLSETMNELALELGGTVSGEHGIGIGKQKYMQAEHGPGAYALMKTLKQAIDPLGIMNPGKMLGL